MSTQPLAPITDAQVNAYDRDGAVHLPGVIDRGWVEQKGPLS